jgi:hypothetical protein
MTTPKDILDIARSEIGITELPPESNHQKFGEWYGYDGIPWCAEFVSYCFYNAGLPIPATTPKGFAACEEGRLWFRSNDAFKNKPQKGDVVFYHFSTGHAGANHVGIVEAVRATSITTIEGNTSGTSNSNGGQVMRRTRTRNSEILGYGRPAFGRTRTKHGQRPSFPRWPGRFILLSSPRTRGADVEEWQTQMKKRRLKIPVDGVFDRSSEKVCLAFQEEQGLELDGVVGPITWAAAWDSPLSG